jgi:putative molybdenum carrier protein
MDCTCNCTQTKNPSCHKSACRNIFQAGVGLFMGASCQPCWMKSMIEKIISGGKPGTEQAALDASIKIGIAYGGWIPKGGHETHNTDAEKYNLHEMPTANQDENFKKNIRESDGTLILSHGSLSRDTEKALRMTRRYSTPLLHVDLNNTSAFNAASLINDWIIDNHLSILHVTGPSQSEDNTIYKATLDILQAVYFLNLTETSMNQPMMGVKEPLESPQNKTQAPKTADTATDIILNEMHLKDRILMANLREKEIAPLQLSLGLYIKEKLDVWSKDPIFIESCVAAAEKEKLDKSNMPMVIIKMLWKKLRDTHRLRVVK